MSTNDVGGDKLISKPNTKEYESNYDRIFRKDEPMKKDKKAPGKKGKKPC